MSGDKTVLVLGATGNQGGATAKHLLARGWRVRALVRDPDGLAAKRLAAQGADVVRGDLNDERSLRAAMHRVHGVFSVLPLPERQADELRQGVSVADAADQAGVAHLVYSSVGGADRNTGIGEFECKASIERHIDALGVPATVLRPVFFMNNLLGFITGDDTPERTLTLALDPAMPMQMISSDDIGFFAAEAFDKPDEFVGARLEIASEALTGPQFADVIGRVTGTPTRFVEQSIEEVGELYGQDGARMFQWFKDGGYRADITALRQRYPALLTLEAFLRLRLG
jgi:uncharacterized protein YbjT (DUF2867 family)